MYHRFDTQTNKRPAAAVNYIAMSRDVSNSDSNENPMRVYNYAVDRRALSFAFQNRRFLFIHVQSMLRNGRVCHTSIIISTLLQLKDSSDNDLR